MMIEREISSVVVDLFRQYPVITITGPRQSGKTTLVRQAFKDLRYVNLEQLETREFARTDPVAFLQTVSMGAILDEIQHVPELLSELQVRIDERRANGLFVLTGSRQFKLMESITQSLAGRTALFKLLPFCVPELEKGGHSCDPEVLIYTGFYPRIYDQGLNPTQALGDYFDTYVERDLRQLSQIRNLSRFQRFTKLCAGRVGQLLNLSSLADDTGISHTTAREWLSLLEASYVVFLLQPYHANIKKRLVKSPKLYFCDVGLATYLLGIDDPAQVGTHPLRGNLFENLAVIEVLKYRYNQGKRANLSFYRDSRGNEVDLLYTVAQHVLPIEVKSGKTITSGYFRGFAALEKVIGDLPYGRLLVYAGDRDEQRSAARVTNVTKLHRTLTELGV